MASIASQPRIAPDELREQLLQLCKKHLEQFKIPAYFIIEPEYATPDMRLYYVQKTSGMVPG